jgi:hypothetical protein
LSRTRKLTLKGNKGNLIEGNNIIFLNNKGHITMIPHCDLSIPFYLSTKEAKMILTFFGKSLGEFYDIKNIKRKKTRRSV